MIFVFVAVIVVVDFCVALSMSPYNIYWQS